MNATVTNQDGKQAVFSFFNNGNAQSASSQASFFVFQNKVQSRPHLNKNGSSNRLKSESRQNETMSPTALNNNFFLITNPGSGVGFNRALKPSERWNSSTRPQTVFNGFGQRKETGDNPPVINTTINNRSSNNIVGIQQLGGTKKTRGHSSTPKGAQNFGYNGGPERIKSAHLKAKSLVSTSNLEKNKFCVTSDSLAKAES